MLKRGLKIFGELMYLILLFGATSLVIIFAGIVVLGLNIRNRFYTLIGKKKK